MKAKFQRQNKQQVKTSPDTNCRLTNMHFVKLYILCVKLKHRWCYVKPPRWELFTLSLHPKYFSSTENWKVSDLIKRKLKFAQFKTKSFSHYCLCWDNFKNNDSFFFLGGKLKIKLLKSKLGVNRWKLNTSDKSFEIISSSTSRFLFCFFNIGKYWTLSAMKGRNDAFLE